MKAYCITLRQTPERESFARQMFDKHNFPVEFVHGIHGCKWGLQTTTSSFTNSKNQPVYIDSGNVGLLLSHYLVWTLAWHQADDPVLVFEDDAILCEGFGQRLDELLKAAPANWQIINLGSTSSDHREETGFFLTKCSYSTAAMLYRKSVLPFILTEMQLAKQPVDNQMGWQVFPFVNHYIYRPDLCINGSCHGDVKSTIQWEAKPRD